jgi:hypothetical protein
MLPFLLIYKGGILLYPFYSNETFTKETNKYLWYDDFKKEGMSYVDEDKNITVHKSCINLSQENHSQYIPFEMPRKYHGVDLMEMTLQIYFVNSQMGANYSMPINVEYSDNRIRFGWLVDYNATAVSGTLMFEIRATGTIDYKDANGTADTTKDLPYIWKTNPNSQITIQKSLVGETTFTPTEDWYSRLIISVGNQVEEARQYKIDAKAAVDSIDLSEETINQAVENAQSYQTAAQSAKGEAELYSKYAKSYAVGGSGLADRASESTNNAKYWCERAENAVTTLSTSVSTNAASISTEVGRATAKEAALENDISALDRKVSTLADNDVAGINQKLLTLISEDENKSAREIAQEELAKQLIAADADEALNSLEEIAAWIQAHPGSAAEMNQAIQGLKTLIGTLPDSTTSTTVVGYIDERLGSITTYAPKKITIGSTVYDGSSDIDFTEAINALIDAKINNTPTYTITYNLTNVTSSNNSTPIVEGSAFDARLTADDGYEIPQDIEITMAGEDISEDAIVAGDQKSIDIRIDSVTGDVVITATGISSTDEPTDEPEEETGTYSVTYNLTNVTSTNTATTASKGYITTLNCVNSEKEITGVKVTMGDVDITDSVATTKGASATISISSVTGDIVITARQRSVSDS